ncbi:MAG: hypothetical protein ACD_61C00250G0001 [uncultured bacterium]|nr:MAG: hypothetical protein ACD_61C00250G0001 [uncultured bacterium]
MGIKGGVEDKGLKGFFFGFGCREVGDDLIQKLRYPFAGFGGDQKRIGVDTQKLLYLTGGRFHLGQGGIDLVHHRNDGQTQVFS